MTAELKASVLADVARGRAEVVTDALASPTGFPFKVASWSEAPTQGVERKRFCYLGYLRNAYRRGDGQLVYRCASEPEDQFVAKGGDIAETDGRKCLCNALMATIGHGQERPAEGRKELPMVTAGDDLVELAPLLRGRTTYSAVDVIEYLLSEAPVPV